MADLIAYAEKMAEKERKQTELIRNKLISEGKNYYGLKLIERVARSVKIDISTVQEEYWYLLKAGKLKLPQ
ncbi:MAG: hypothetical protein R3251_00065 [Candidatus Spechtbacterales bacterium]|nr:hypothetical protein [Candidatus Spechtbacterales bacterium]